MRGIGGGGVWRGPRGSHTMSALIPGRREPQGTAAISPNACWATETVYARNAASILMISWGTHPPSGIPSDVARLVAIAIPSRGSADETGQSEPNARGAPLARSDAIWY